MNSLTLALPGTLGNNTGASSHGGLIGTIAATALTKCFINRSWDSAGQACITDDGGLYVNETTPFNEATTDDVEVFPATPAADDACYFGADVVWNNLTLVISTAGDGVWTNVWEYKKSDGTWATLSVTDGTTGWLAVASTVAVTFTPPADWIKTDVDGVYKYWIRSRLSAYTSVVAAPQVARGFIYSATGVWVDETTDINSAGAADVPLLSASPLVGDAVYFGYTGLWTKLKITLSTALSATLTGAFEYWNGSIWTAVPFSRDDSTGFSAGTSTYLLHMQPPADWTAVAVNGSAALYWVRFRITAFTSLTTAPVATQAWVLPIVGAPLTGFQAPSGMTAVTYTRAVFNFQTPSGSTADSVFMLLNKTTGVWRELTKTKATSTEVLTVSFTVNADDEIALIQVAEDGSTEFANGSLTLLAA